MKVQVAPPSEDMGQSKGLMLVKVKDIGKDKFGWYGGKRCRPGEPFYLFKPEDFSGSWMEIVKASQEQRDRVPLKYREAVGGKMPEPEKGGKKKD